MRAFLEKIIPFIFLGIMLVIFVVGIVLFSYLLIIGALVGLVLFAIAWLKEKLSPSKSVTKVKKQGRIIEHK